MRTEHPTFLSLLLSTSDKTRDEEVEGFLACAADHGEDAALSVRTLRRWANGQVLTEPAAAQGRVAMRYWGYPIGELLAPPLPSSSPSGGLILPPATGQLATLERQIIMSVRRATRFAALAESTNAGAETLELLRQEVTDLAAAYPQTSATMLAGDLVELQGFLFDLLEGRQRPAQTVELYVMAAYVTGMLAKACQDLGRYQQAMGFARTMGVCAENAGHTPLQAWSKNLQSLIEYWFGRPLAATEHAQAGLALCEPSSGSVAAWLASSESRAWGQLKSADDTRAALARAERFRDRHAPDDLDQFGGLFAFPLAKQQYYAAGALVCLDGANDDAAGAAVRALGTYEAGPASERSFSDEAGARCELALARVRSGEVDGARDALEAVLDLPPAQRIGGIITSVQRVHAALLSPNLTSSRPARALAEEIETFTRAPATSVFL